VSIDNTGSLVKNASLEWKTGASSLPDCWQAGGYGTNTFSWTRTSDAHSGGWAERVDITSFTSGDRKLLQKLDGGLCAPAVLPGDTYTVSTWFKSDINPYFVVFTRNSSGAWSFWTSSPRFSGSPTNWTQAIWKLPAIPAGTTNISYGLNLKTVGFLTVDDFNLACDIGCYTTPPTSSASSSPYSASESFPVSYTAADNAGGSGLARVDLYAKAPGQTTYSEVASVTGNSPSGSFSYTATAGDGAYSFYTIATDRAGNVQATPTGPTTTTTLDTTPPTSSARSPAYSASEGFPVNYIGVDNAGDSGLARVDLYAKAPGQAAYAEVASNTSGRFLGSFSYTATAGDGAYSFYTIATDRAGNVQATPASPNTTTMLDTIPPTAPASLSAAPGDAQVALSWGASTDNVAVAGYRVYRDGVQIGQASSTSFNDTGLTDGTAYTYYVVAYDAAGNVSSPSATVSATPTSAASSGGSGPQTVWTAVGTLPLSDAQAAALVTHRPEQRPDNVAANDYVPTSTQLVAFHSALNQYGQTSVEENPLNTYVDGLDGLANPSTDDLIQWGAHKWGIPEEWLRAEYVQESYWHQNALGDRASVANNWYTLYPLTAQIAGTSEVNESMGITQVKWKPDGSQAPGTEPLRWQSTAFNIDYQAAQIRYYYDGYCNWCTTGYTPGQQWNSIGAWYSPYPWNNTDAQSYIALVQKHLTEKPWLSPSF
jgi:chitodextrinase